MVETISYSSPSITNSTIACNSADNYGGGINVYDGDPVLVNSILWGNTALSAADGNEVYLFDAIYTTIKITFSAIDPGDIKGPGISTLSSTINDDPLFVNSRPASEAPTIAGDYHLQSGSPCINQGTANGAPDNDIDGDIRPQDTYIDMGSDEYVAP